MKWKQFKILDLIKNAIIHCWRVGKLVFLSLVFSSLFKCLSEIAEIYLLQQLFSSVTLYLNNQNDMRNVISAVVGLGVILVLAQVIQLWEYLSQGYFWRRGNGYFHALLHERLGKEQALSYENPEFLNRYEKATVGCEDAPDAVECVCHMLCYYIPFFVLTVVYLYRLAPAMILAIVILLLSSLISEWIKARQTYEFENQVSDFNRKCEHYENCIVSKEYVKETRFLGAAGFFMKKYDDTMKMYHKKFLQKETNHLKNGILLNIVDICAYLCIFGILLYYMKLGKIHVVEFATIYFAIDKVKHTMEDMLAMIGEAMQSVVRMSFLFEFLQEEEMNKKKNETHNEICLKNVSFSYPFCSKKVLEDINLQIRKGETIAIVGDNGAGKSTLTKVLIGLYPPTEGTVTYGGEISGVFQSFNQYCLTLEENIRISHFSENHNCKNLLKKVGVNVESFLEQENTLLGKEFGGTELSGGQWQRVAIARGLYKISDVIVLDEPTAAIDPLEERYLFEMFQKISEGKTCILVTHRMGAVKMADRIFMMGEGKIIEEGTHEELMEFGGKYKELFDLQAKWYK